MIVGTDFDFRGLCHRQKSKDLQQLFCMPQQQRGDVQGIIQVLKNLQTVLQIVFSTASAKCLDVFIDHLKGELRLMESVASDFLRDSIELALRNFSESFAL